MDQEPDAFERSVRKFLKQLGVTAHQELRTAMAGSGAPKQVRAVITLEGSDFRHEIEAELSPPD